MVNLLLRMLPRAWSESASNRMIVDILAKYIGTALIIAAGIVVSLSYTVGRQIEGARDVLGVVVVVILVLVAIRLFEHLWGIRFGPDRSIEDVQRRLVTIEEDRERERKEYESQINGLRVQISFLTKQYEEAVKKIGELEAKESFLAEENERLRKAVPPVQIDEIPDIPLLHICGDEEFCRQDRVQLNRARVPYRALDAATKKDVEDEMQRRREDGTEYYWMLVSAHGTKDGVVLKDGIAEPFWWNQAIDPKTRLVVFANCDGPEVGDALAGIAYRVVVMYGDIPTEDASAFILALFRAKLRGRGSDEAFLIARKQVPQIAAYVDIRRA